MEEKQEEYKKIIGDLAKNLNETVRLKREYHNMLIGVVGVCFGVLVAMKDNDGSQTSNWLYFVGLVCCAISLTLLVIGAWGAIAVHKNKQDKLVDELVEKALGCSTTKQRKKSIKGYRICRKVGYGFFFASIVLFCMYSYFSLFK